MPGFSLLRRTHIKPLSTQTQPCSALLSTSYLSHLFAYGRFLGYHKMCGLIFGHPMKFGLQLQATKNSRSHRDRDGTTKSTNSLGSSKHPLPNPVVLKTLESFPVYSTPFSTSKTLSSVKAASVRLANFTQSRINLRETSFPLRPQIHRNAHACPSKAP